MISYIHKIYTYEYVNTHIYVMVKLAGFSFYLFFFFLFSEFYGGLYILSVWSFLHFKDQTPKAFYFPYFLIIYFRYIYEELP